MSNTVRSMWQTAGQLLAVIANVKVWQLCIVLVFGLVVAASLLRLDNLGMVSRRQAVIDADAAGDQAAIQASLVELQRYVSSHMNASLGSGVYLQKTYEKARNDAVAAAADKPNEQSAVYQQASVECRSKFVGGVQSFRNDYVRCVLDRVSALSEGQPIASATIPSIDMYRYNFASPRWSPDPAGWSIVFCLVVTGLIVIRIVVAGVVRRMTSSRYRGAM